MKIFNAPASSNTVINSGTSTDNAIARYDGTTGKRVQDSSATVADNGDIVTTGKVRVFGGDNGRYISIESNYAGLGSANHALELSGVGNERLWIVNDATSGEGIFIRVNGAIRMTISPNGNIILPTLPTADPHVAGGLWNDSGTMKISAG